MRTYVVLACTLPFGPASVAEPVGTVVAPTIAAARALGETLARSRGHAPSWTCAVRVRRASACRTAWVLAALARDGAAPA